MKLPAYGRDLIKLQQSGRNVAWLCISLNFALGRSMPRVVVTDDADIAELDLRCATGLNCLIAHEGKTPRAMAIAELALRHGATLTTIHDQRDDSTITTSELIAIKGLA